MKEDFRFWVECSFKHVFQLLFPVVTIFPCCTLIALLQILWKNWVHVKQKPKQLQVERCRPQIKDSLSEYPLSQCYDNSDSHNSKTSAQVYLFGAGFFNKNNALLFGVSRVSNCLFQFLNLITFFVNGHYFQVKTHQYTACSTFMKAFSNKHERKPGS